MDWTIPMMIPSTSQIVRLRPFLNKHHEHVIKYEATKDYIGLVQYFKELLQHLCVEQLDINKLPVIDQVLLLLRLRAVCIGPTCVLVIPEEKTSDETEQTSDDKKAEESEDKSYNVSLVDLQRDIMSNYIQPIQIGDPHEIHVTVHYPNCWTKPSTSDYVKSVTINNKTIDKTSLTDQEFDILIDELPVDIINKINRSIDKFKNNIRDRIYIKTIESKPDIHMDHDLYIDILSVLYNEPLENFMEQIYVFVKFINMTMEDVMNMSPLDTQMYYKLFEKENREREATNNKKTS